MNDWKTTISGALAALLPWSKTVVPVAYHPIIDVAASAALLALGWHAAQVK